MKEIWFIIRAQKRLMWEFCTYSCPKKVGPSGKEHMTQIMYNQPKSLKTLVRKEVV